jgi:hypothetical protein
MDTLDVVVAFLIHVHENSFSSVQLEVLTETDAKVMMFWGVPVCLI